jgi:hypothetical protein
MRSDPNFQGTSDSVSLGLIVAKTLTGLFVMISELLALICLILAGFGVNTVENTWVAGISLVIAVILILSIQILLGYHINKAAWLMTMFRQSTHQPTQFVVRDSEQ